MPSLDWLSAWEISGLVADNITDQLGVIYNLSNLFANMDQIKTFSKLTNITNIMYTPSFKGNNNAKGIAGF